MRTLTKPFCIYIVLRPCIVLKNLVSCINNNELVKMLLSFVLVMSDWKIQYWLHCCLFSFFSLFLRKRKKS